MENIMGEAAELLKHTTSKPSLAHYVMNFGQSEDNNSLKSISDMRVDY